MNTVKFYKDQEVVLVRIHQTPWDKVSKKVKLSRLRIAEDVMLKKGYTRKKPKR